MDSKCENLLDLNEDCLLAISKYLNLNDLMNVAETCRTFKGILDQSFRKYSTFVLDINNYRTVEKVPKSINRILRHTGRHVTSLEIRCTDEYPCNRLLEWIDCGKLKKLKISHLKPACQKALSTHSFGSLELCTICYCDLVEMKSVLKNLDKLKCLNVCDSKIGQDDLLTILGNNPRIESFTIDERNVGNVFDCQLLELIPKVQRFALCCPKDGLLNWKVLSELQFLTTLRVDGSVEIKNVLGQFANKSMLKELELHNVYFDESYVNVLKDFEKLEMLYVHHDYKNFPFSLLSNTSAVWPPNIKRLYLSLRVSREFCTSTIRQLKFLEQFDAMFDFRTYNADEVFKNIYEIVANRGQKLYLTLPWCFIHTFGGREAKFGNRFIDSDQLKIFQSEKHDDDDNSMNIHATFEKTAVDCKCRFNERRS